MFPSSLLSSVPASDGQMLHMQTQLAVIVQAHLKVAVSSPYAGVHFIWL